MFLLAAGSSEPATVVQWVIIGLTYLLIAVLFFAFFVLPIWALIEAAVTDRQVWRAVGRDKTGWILAILFGSAIGAGIYWFAVRPQLRNVKSQRQRHPSDSPVGDPPD